MHDPNLEGEKPQHGGAQFREELRDEADFNFNAHTPQFLQLLESAARIQQVVPDAVMVGGSASALYARHRFSTDHDHVSATLEQNYKMVLEALDATDGWVANFRSSPPKTILGMESGFEAGIRQLRRNHPLEVTTVRLPSGAELVIPTHDEILRIKGYLIVNRNQMRDYLDTAALAESLGINRARAVLRQIDYFYSEMSNTDGAVSTVLSERLYQAKPRDHKAIANLPSYKGLAPQWRNWKAVESICRELAEGML